MLRADIRLYRGDDKRFKFSLYRKGEAYNVVGSHFALTVTPDDGSEALSLDEDDIQTFENYAVVHFPHAKTKDLTWTRGEYDLQMTTADGDVYTIARGYVKLTHDITR